MEQHPLIPVLKLFKEAGTNPALLKRATDEAVRINATQLMFAEFNLISKKQSSLPLLYRDQVILIVNSILKGCETEKSMEIKDQRGEVNPPDTNVGKTARKYIEESDTFAHGTILKDMSKTGELHVGVDGLKDTQIWKAEDCEILNCKYENKD